MAEQLRLDIPRPPRETRQVVFFAIMPDAAEGARLTELGKQISPARLHPVERFHLSLLGFQLESGLQDAQIRAAREIGAAVAAAPFEVVLPIACSFGDSLVLCCGDPAAAAMSRLQAMLSVAVEGELGLRARRRYAPHLTLAYRAPRIPPTSLSNPISWRAREFALIGSAQGQGRYTWLGRWPLRPRPDVFTRSTP